MRKVYLDHAATTPVAAEVADAMARYMTERFGNPSSIHAWGRESRKALEEAREQVAALIGAQPGEIFFTSGGTEADNLALRGIMYSHRQRGDHLITSQVEHHAVLHTAEELEKEGLVVTRVGVDQDALVDPEAIRAAITPRTVLVSVMMANNEVGTIEPIAELARVCHEREVLVHTDAVQAVGQVSVDVNSLGVDLLSLSGHKLYGPKGIGALYVRRRTRLHPLLFGGSQERRLRPGTENVPGIIGLGKAAELAREQMSERRSHLLNLRERLIGGLLQLPGVRLNGHRSQRLPGNVNISVAGVDGEALLLNLDLKGIAVSSGSACSAGALEPSHVIRAMGVPAEFAHGALRLTLGRGNTEEDVDYVLGVLPEVVRRLRELSPPA